MLWYRLWGLVAAIIGYFLTGFFLALLGIDISSDDEKCVGLLVGFTIYFAPLIIFGRKKKTEPSTESALPELSESDIAKIKPFTQELVQRVNAGEDMEIVVKSIADRANVSIGHVLAYAFILAKLAKEKSSNN